MNNKKLYKNFNVAQDNVITMELLGEFEGVKVGITFGTTNQKGGSSFVEINYIILEQSKDTTFIENDIELQVQTIMEELLKTANS